MPWAYPHTFTDGTGMVASGVQVDDNFATVQGKVEANETALAGLVLAGHQVLLRGGEVSATTDGGGLIAVLFAPAFPTALLYVVATSCDLGTDPVYRLQSRSRTGFTAFFNDAAKAQIFNYIAVGY